MNRVRLLGLLLMAVATIGLVGCGNSGPTLMTVTGTVTYQGNPVPKATVNIMPAKGAAAMATTDDAGKFVAQTSGQPGVSVGPAKVMVTLVKMVGAPDKIEDSPEAAAKISELVNSGKIRYVSAIPTKYGNPDTTTLEITVSEDAAKNDFPLVLTD